MISQKRSLELFLAAASLIAMAGTSPRLKLAIVPAATASSDTCITGLAGTLNSIPFAPQLESFTVEFYATALSTPLEAAVGVSCGAPSSSAGLAAFVRFGSDGTLGASAHRPSISETVLQYQANTTYRVRLFIRAWDRRYDADITPVGGEAQRLAANYPMRGRVNSLLDVGGRSLDRLVLIVTSGSLRVCDLSIAPSPESGIKGLWAVNDGEKVDRNDLNNPNKASNSAWDGKRVKLSAARNEIVAFQLIIETGSNGIDTLSVDLPMIQQRGGSGFIAYSPPALDPSDYVRRPIQIFSENYLYVSKPTTASWIYRLSTPSAPRNPTGWKPVQLIPENARISKGGFPLKIEPLSNQAIWIDIYVYRNLPSGLYDGTILVSANGRPRTIPLELEVFDFALPDENSMHAMIYYESEQPQLYQGKNLDLAYHRFAHRQRIELVTAYSTASATTALGRFRGDDFNAPQGYEGPGENSGNKIVPASFYSPGNAYDERSSAWTRSDAWMYFLEQALPGAITFLYMPDEPSSSEYDRIWKIADNIHSNPGPGRRLPIFVTHRYDSALDGAIDIWCSPPGGYDIARALQERSKSRDYWIYNGGRPAGPAIVIDSPATDPRATIWACFKHAIRVYFYWHAVHWRHNSQMKPGADRNQNVWANPITYDNGQDYANGDGVLIYPGEEMLHPEEDRGIAGPCSTLQMANFRRGLQDHQYLTIARKLGLDSEVDEALSTVVPRMFSEAGTNVGFAETGNVFEETRQQLARAIATAIEHTATSGFRSHATARLP
jgi:hypothetical protein